MTSTTTASTSPVLVLLLIILDSIRYIERKSYCDYYTTTRIYIYYTIYDALIATMLFT